MSRNSFRILIPLFLLLLGPGLASRAWAQNDAFASRTLRSGDPLVAPVTSSGTNGGATKETGEILADGVDSEASTRRAVIEGSLDGITFSAVADLIPLITGSPATGFAITIASESGKTYRLQTSANLTSWADGPSKLSGGRRLP